MRAQKKKTHAPSKIKIEKKKTTAAVSSSPSWRAASPGGDPGVAPVVVSK